MAQQSEIKYYIITYTSFSHNYVKDLLSANDDASYRYEIHQTEQDYSKFLVYSSLETFKKLRDASLENNENAFTIEYGSV